MGGDITAVIAAGLPNITGTFYSAKKTNSTVENPVTGAFRKINWSGTGYGAGNVANLHTEFNAALSNEIYGKSDKVLPESFALIVQIKY